MSSIRILSDRVANQIAAGEVIERPAAVVKELVENSIDAGATRINIEFRNGGKSYIRIEDNGKGMLPNEAMLSLERHATSKINEADDLNQIKTFGFRGEALPSIASVSKFTLRTRSEETEHGTEISINGGKIISQKDCGMPIGTTIEVAYLFNSVPARRKFLKTEPTETAHITYSCRLFALAHPDIAFQVSENGRTVFQSPTCTQLQDRIAEIWGHTLSKELIPMDSKDQGKGFRLSGLIAKPGIGRSTRRELITLVNRRPVNSRTLSLAVLDAYHGRLQKGRFPPAFLFLDVPPQDVDVNVHPAKREVRFNNNGIIRRFVFNSVTEALTSEQLQTQTQTTDPEKVTNLNQNPKTPAYKPVQKSTSDDSARPTTNQPKNTDAKIQSAGKIQPVLPKQVTEVSKEQSLPNPQPILHNITDNKPAKNNTLIDWHLVALLKKRYALFETDSGLLFLNIRHADQRVRFERICNHSKHETKQGQRLLIPQPIELEPLASNTLKTQLEQLNTQGFQVEEFGRNFYRIETVPTWLAPEQAEQFIRDFVDIVRLRSGLRKQGELDSEAIAKLAVKDSYQRNDSLTEPAVQQLAKDLFACKTPHTSPFGKPTYNEVSWSEWERRFEGR